MSGMESGTKSCPVMGDYSIWDTELFISASKDECDIFYEGNRRTWPVPVAARSKA